MQFVVKGLSDEVSPKNVLEDGLRRTTQVKTYTQYFSDENKEDDGEPPKTHPEPESTCMPRFIKKPQALKAAKVKVYPCNLCAKVFQYEGSHANHVKTHDADYPLQCSHCKKTFRYTRVFQNHINFMKCQSNVRASG